MLRFIHTNFLTHVMSKVSSQSGLAKVQSLYTLQLELYKVLDGQITKDDKKEAMECAKKFSKLLQEVDWRYMGGEDVYDELLTMHREVIDRLKKLPTSAVQKKTQESKAKGARPKSKGSSKAKATRKKPVAKKKVVTKKKVTVAKKVTKKKLTKKKR